MSAVEHAVTFASGFAIECACVFWVHYSERGRAASTALCSMLIAGAQVLGIGSAVRDFRFAPAFVLGYGAGTYCAVKLKVGLGS
jgi:hypothetical protein